MAASCTARSSTLVTPRGVEIMTLGRKSGRNSGLGVAGNRLDEVAQHGLGHHEVGDHAVADGAGHFDALRGAAQHIVGLVAHRHHGIVAQADGHHRWLMEDNAPALDVDEDIDRPQIDADVFSKHNLSIIPCAETHPKLIWRKQANEKKSLTLP